MAPEVRTALMHELGMVLIAVSNGHLYRNCRGIRQIEHYVLMPDDGEICKNFSSSLQESFTFTKARALIHANTFMCGCMKRT